MRECDEVPGGIFDSDFARAIKRRSFGHVDFRFGDRGFDPFRSSTSRYKNEGPFRTSPKIAGMSFSTLAYDW